MIHELRIRGLGVIAATGCSFAPGFTVVTGETGAGKTMVVTSLGLLTGGRSDTGLAPEWRRAHRGAAPGLVAHGAPCGACVAA